MARRKSIPKSSRARSAISGRFVTKAWAKRSRKTTVIESVK